MQRSIPDDAITVQTIFGGSGRINNSSVAKLLSLLDGKNAISGRRMKIETSTNISVCFGKVQEQAFALGRDSWKMPGSLSKRQSAKKDKCQLTEDAFERRLQSCTTH